MILYKIITEKKKNQSNKQERDRTRVSKEVCDITEKVEV